MIDFTALYQERILEPLAQGSAVSCFLALDGDGDTAMLYVKHSFTGQTERASRSRSDLVRATVAIQAQRRAREFAATQGCRAVVT